MELNLKYTSTGRLLAVLLTDELKTLSLARGDQMSLLESFKQQFVDDISTVAFIY